jgi:hypothetical protein
LRRSRMHDPTPRPPPDIASASHRP